MRSRLLKLMTILFWNRPSHRLRSWLRNRFPVRNPDDGTRPKVWCIWSPETDDNSPAVIFNTKWRETKRALDCLALFHTSKRYEAGNLVLDTHRHRNVKQNAGGDADGAVFPVLFLYSATIFTALRWGCPESGRRRDRARRSSSPADCPARGLRSNIWWACTVWAPPWGTWRIPWPRWEAPGSSSTPRPWIKARITITIEYWRRWLGEGSPGWRWRCRRRPWPLTRRRISSNHPSWWTFPRTTLRADGRRTAPCCSGNGRRSWIAGNRGPRPRFQSCFHDFKEGETKWWILGQDFCSDVSQTECVIKEMIGTCWHSRQPYCRSGLLCLSTQSVRLNKALVW